MTAEPHQLPNWESLELLRSTTIGRLCVLEGEYPIAMPINYRIVELVGAHAAVVRTAPNTVLARFEGPASLEVDDIDLDAGSAWSVIARGQLHRVLGEHSLPDPRPLVTIDRDQWMMLSISALSGRRFTIEVAADGFSVEWQLA